MARAEGAEEHCSSPDMNPIEPAWAKLKNELRRVGPRTADALHRALGPALDSVTALAFYKKG